ncbi:MAG TPA: hypothetical protein VKU44_06805 [Terriglobia bacterium]|nr:hypothetical protein [Terriglobia bacterium]
MAYAQSVDITDLHFILATAQRALGAAVILACVIGLGHSLVCFLRMPGERAGETRRRWRSPESPTCSSEHGRPAATGTISAVAPARPILH